MAVLSLGNEAGDKEYLYLPTDISAMDKVKKRLNIAAFAEGIVNGIENIRLPESILPSPEDMCMSLQGDVQKLTLLMRCARPSAVLMKQNGPACNGGRIRGDK